jgi:hypothetical protein
MSLRSHLLESRLRNVAIALLTALAGAGLVNVGSARADAITTHATVNVGNDGIPASPPKYIHGGDSIPTATGTMGNATELFVGAGYQNTNQVMGVQNGSTAWGTPVTTSVATGSHSQQWYFQRVGWINMHTPMVDLLNFDPPSVFHDNSLEQVPVYKIINYNGNSVTCLDAYGGSGAADSAVDSYGCNPNQANQANQLWVISYARPFGEEGEEVDTPMSPGSSPWIDKFVYPQYSAKLQPNPWASGVIENVASLAANGWNTAQAPVLTASFNDLAGFDSPLKLEPQSQWNTLSKNSTWGTVDPNGGSGSGQGSGQGPSCSPFACLIGS